MNDVDVDDFIEPEADVEDSYYEWSKKYKKARRLIHQKILIMKQQQCFCWKNIMPATFLLHMS